MNSATRRRFLQTLAAGGALAALPCPAAPGDAPSGFFPDGKPPDEVLVELRRRTAAQLEQSRLVVDYYRVGRKLAYPLPLAQLTIPDVVVPGIKNYPWSTWLLWTLEERILTLGWAVEWLQNPRAHQAAVADLLALAAWPQYQENDQPGLSSAHAARILWTAVTRWRWPDGDLKGRLRAGCRRHVETSLPVLRERCRALSTPADVLAAANVSAAVHNIGLIGLLGTALAAAAAYHPAAEQLNAWCAALFGAVLELRGTGFSEGVAYDGYVLDFVADWLTTLSAAERGPVLEHPRLEEFLDQSYMLACPGAPADVAELGDVEPREMPFHLSAQAKLQGLRPHPLRAWLLAGCPPERLRTDGLAAWGLHAGAATGKAPPAGPLDAHYALVLRSGWRADDLAVAVSCSTSPMGHLHNDSGTLVLGTAGRWLIADPGYQQYLPGDERQFTLGPTAHNAPRIDGKCVAQKRPRRLALESPAPDLQYAAVDLTACYPPLPALKRLVRHVWLAGRDLVVVADELATDGPLPLCYPWHGHPEAAWWFEAGGAVLARDGCRLWIDCPQCPLSGSQLQLLPGSRGQMTLVAELQSAGPAVWWVFAVGGARPAVELAAEGRRLRVGQREFAVGQVANLPE